MDNRGLFIQEDEQVSKVNHTHPSSESTTVKTRSNIRTNPVLTTANERLAR